MTCGLEFSREVVARGEEAAKLGTEAGSWGSCFQVRSEGAEVKLPTGLMVGRSRLGVEDMETGAGGWGSPASEGGF